ncbi:hypothetical protein [Streptomyces goshikiensis]|uniref:hypothetical protein n=1 Tax=Streptomyces goshikiensis TaxID=1942 RepID=UPI00369679EA
MPTPTPLHARGTLIPAQPSPVRQVSADAVPAFVELVYDPSRIKPLILLTHAPRRGAAASVDPLRVHEELGEYADVAVLTNNPASEALQRALPDLGLWGDAARIYRPDAVAADPHHRHPIVPLPSLSPEAALAAIRDRLHNLGVAYTTASSHSADALPALPAETPDRALVENARLRAVLGDREQTVTDLRKEVQRLSKQLRAADSRTSVDTPIVYEDPETQWRYEVEQCWLRSVPETERPDFPLTAYQLGPDWLDSLTAVELVDRRKVVEVTVEVLTGRAPAVPGRQVHRMRSRGERGAGAMIRPGDQAIGMRCYLKHTASGPRMMWWRLADSIELGRIALHDDTQLR